MMFYEDKARKREDSKILKIYSLLVSLIILFSSCREASINRFNPKSRFIKLTSGYTEIVVYSAKVPGYWASQNGDGTKYFLFLNSYEGSYKKNDLLTVEGEIGTVPASVFDEETRIYLANVPTNILIAWKSVRIDIEKER